MLSFDERDGVTGRFFVRGAAFRSRRGELYFGTSRGLTRFLPEGFEANRRVPAVVLTGLSLGSRPVVAGLPGSPLSAPIHEATELVLPHDAADVTFTFAALNYILPQKNRYTHRLEGLDRDWSPVGPETSATYVRIPPGDYVFRVRACNNDGVWNTDGVSLRLHVTPPFWQTRAFAAAIALTLAGAGVLLHKARVRRVRQRFLAVLDERRRLSRDLHDTLEQGLAGIALQVDSARQHLGRRPEVVERCLETALHMVDHSREETRRTVNQLRSQALEAGDIAQAVREVARELTTGGEPLVAVEVRGAPRRLSVAAEHHLFRIAQEALTNAVTHAKARRVSVTITFAGDAVEIAVSDDGRGLLAEKPERRFQFGLSGMRERARALGTRLEVDSAPGHGTTIRVRWSERRTRRRRRPRRESDERRATRRRPPLSREKNDVPCRCLPTPRPRARGRAADRARGDGRDGGAVHRHVEAGAKIDRNIFGQFAEHLGTRHLRGRLGRSRLHDPEHPRHPQRRGRRAEGAQGAERALAGRLLRRRVPLAQGHRPAAARRDAQPELGRRDGAEHVRHARVHGLHRPDRQRGLPLGQRRLGHAAGSRRVAGVHDDRAADDAGARSARRTATRRRTRSPSSGIGNESWDCGGNMTPEYYLSQLKIYSRFVRNFNPAQQQDGQQMLKIAVGPGGDGPRWTEWTETIMKAWQGRTWSWDIDGLSLHNYTVVEVAACRTRRSGSARPSTPRSSRRRWRWTA